jgi:hypothetical protein
MNASGIGSLILQLSYRYRGTIYPGDAFRSGMQDWMIGDVVENTERGCN